MSARATDAVQVALDAAELGPIQNVGNLHHRRVRSSASLSFAYLDTWLRSPGAFLLDPRLALYGGEQSPAAGHAAFGIFLDSAPDRWGRLLLDRREALLAREEKRRPRTLDDWDYLLGVQDECRMGALRFRRDDEQAWLDRYRHCALHIAPFQGPASQLLRAAL